MNQERTLARLAHLTRLTGLTPPLRLGLTAAGAGLVAIGIAASSGEEADLGTEVAAERPAPVRIARVRHEVVPRPITVPGTLAPKDEITLSFKVAGVIERVAVDAGETVRSGQMLAALQLSETDAAVSRARSAAEKAERDLARAERLYADSVVTLAQLQDAGTAAQVAAADLVAARFNRRHAVIVAPANGSILARHADPGETVSPGTPVLVLGSRSRGAVVRAGLADRDAVRIRLGDHADVRFAALRDRVFEGAVTEIAAAAEPATGTYAVEIGLPAAGDLAAGLVGTVELQPGGGAAASTVPIEAILEADGNEAAVFAVTPDGARVERRRVDVAFLSADRVVVARGLEGVEHVVTDGAAYLTDGDAVTVMP